MEFTFHSSVPAAEGRTYIDKDNADELIEELMAHPNQWAQVPITYLYPDLEGSKADKLKAKTRNIAGRIQKETLAPFNEYTCKAKSRGTDVFIMLVMSPREAREMRNLYDD